MTPRPLRPWRAWVQRRLQAGARAPYEGTHDSVSSLVQGATASGRRSGTPATVIGLRERGAGDGQGRAMIRGCIEVAQGTRVAGWIYASTESLRDKLILAFVGARCVGAGKVDRFRKDLFDARLGDGYCGFDFPIKLEEGEGVGGIVVRLQNSDAALIQPASVVSGPEEVVSDSPDLGALPPAAVTWMHDRGMLEQPEHDFLRAVHTIGAYERGLRAPRRRLPGTVAETQEPARPDAVARDLFSLYVLGDVIITERAVAGIMDLGARDGELPGGTISILALWAAERGCISLDERSHLGPAQERGHVLAAPPPGGIDYHYGPDRLLLVHRACSFSPRGPAPASGIIVFSGAVNDARPAAPRRA